MNIPSGVLVLDKAAGISSAKAIAQVKHKLGLKKIGHAGTLDPAATGILVCLINDATKAAKLFEGGEKTYTGTFKLGVTTDTDDLDGEVITHNEDIPSFELIEAAAKKFIGIIEQTPPTVSAVKVNGERAYDLYRSKGVTPVLKSRTVTVYEFELRPTEAPDIVEYKVRSTCGTYVRSLARDLGIALGCGCAVATLRRTGSAPFQEQDAVKLEDLSEANIQADFKSKMECAVCQH